LERLRVIAKRCIVKQIAGAQIERNALPVLAYKWPPGGP
jgi:hypothetical protein